MGFYKETIKVARHIGHFKEIFNNQTGFFETHKILMAYEILRNLSPYLHLGSLVEDVIWISPKGVF